MAWRQRARHLLSRTARPALLACAIGFSCSLIAHLVLRRVDTPSPFDRPVELGRLNGVNVFLCCGDVALPNQLVRGDDGRLDLDTRFKDWTACVITAPVPAPTADGSTLVIPWTLLPTSVVESVRLVDAEFATRLERSLGLKESSSEWHFARMTRLNVPAETRYAEVTGMRSLYAVNMFEFTGDLGTAYGRSICDAISSAVMTAVQQSADDGESSIAIPAMCAALHVTDRSLVVSYWESFSSILDGIERASGKVPASVHLVLWRNAHSRAEQRAAANGLEAALYDGLPAWRDRLRNTLVGAMAVTFVLGVLWSMWRQHGQFSRSAAWRILVLSIAAVGAAVGATFIDWSLEVVQAAKIPATVCGLCAACAFILGAVVETIAPGATGVAVSESAA